MEHESFEDPETAALMNELFVNASRSTARSAPIIDQIYMDAVLAHEWPGRLAPQRFSANPDGEPFYGGTYFPPEPRHGMPAFRQVLEAA